MVVSPGYVVSRAPCAQPRRSASFDGEHRQEPVEEARREAVSAADAVHHVELERRSLVDRSADGGDRAPRVAAGRVNLAQGGRDQADVRELARDAVDHADER